MRRSIVEHETRLHVARDLAMAAAAAAIAVVFCQLVPSTDGLFSDTPQRLFAVVAAALVAPAFISGAIGGLRNALKRVGGAEGLIAGRSLVASLARTSVVVTALATAISIMVSVG